MFIIKDLARYGLGYIKAWPIKGRPEYTVFRDEAVQFDTRLEASRFLNYHTYWTRGSEGAECNLRLAVVERDA